MVRSQPGASGEASYSESGGGSAAGGGSGGSALLRVSRVSAGGGDQGDEEPNLPRARNISMAEEDRELCRMKKAARTEAVHRDHD